MPEIIDSTNTVVIPRDEYAMLLNAETRLGILRNRRLNEIQNSSYASLETEDFILGGDVVTAVINKKKADKGE